MDEAQTGRWDVKEGDRQAERKKERKRQVCVCVYVDMKKTLREERLEA